jgi:hypothetical protein
MGRSRSRNLSLTAPGSAFSAIHSTETESSISPAAERITGVQTVLCGSCVVGEMAGPGLP